jgi:hypothetical protein
MTVSTLNQHPILPKSTTSLPLRAEGHPEHEAGRPDLTLAQIDAFGAGSVIIVPLTCGR